MYAVSFFLAAHKIFCLLLIMSDLIDIPVHFSSHSWCFGFIELLGSVGISFLLNLEIFFDISKSFFFLPSPSPLGTLMLGHLKFSYRSLMFCLLFLIFLSLCFSLDSFCCYVSRFADCLPMSNLPLSLYWVFYISSQKF